MLWANTVINFLDLIIMYAFLIMIFQIKNSLVQEDGKGHDSKRGLFLHCTGVNIWRQSGKKASAQSATYRSNQRHT